MESASGDAAWLPRRLEWSIAVFALLVQQNAFVLVPFIVRGESFRSVVNPYNTAAVSLSLATVVLLSAVNWRELTRLARSNVSSLGFTAYALLSTIWSIHPELTVRRGVGYILTILIAAMLVVRFDLNERFKVLSLSFVISAIGSVLFVATVPSGGIMQVGELAGAWRGVFPHKNVMGPIMAAAVFTQLYLLLSEKRRRPLHCMLLLLFLALVILSRSKTALLMSGAYLLSALMLSVWQRRRLLARTIGIVAALLGLMGALLVWGDPGAVLDILGKDATLTGRTTLWSVVLSFIQERPILGWGYYAMWQVGDPTTTYADRMTGNWGVMNSENAFLSITLELGIVGLGLILAIIAASLHRSVTCCRRGAITIGWLSTTYFFGALVAGQTTENLGHNQVVEWLIFSMLAFSCGHILNHRLFARPGSLNVSRTYTPGAHLITAVRNM